VTVGIAALCRTSDLGDTVVVAADTQVSRGFTSSLSAFKLQILSGRWLSIMAGNNLGHADRLVSAISSGLHRALINVSGVDEYPTVMQVLRTARADVALQVACEDALPPGMTLQEFYANGKANLPEGVSMSIWDTLNQSRPDCNLLVAGVDDLGRAHIATVGLDLPYDHDRLNFCAVGSGTAMALGILSAYDHSEHDMWQETVYRVWAAKKIAERAQGVGPETTMIVIDAEGASRRCSLRRHTLERRSADSSTHAIHSRLYLRYLRGHSQHRCPQDP